jgi:hypothetical protein
MAPLESMTVGTIRGSGETRRSSRPPPRSSLSAPATESVPPTVQRTAIKLPSVSNWPFHSFVFRLSEVAMAVRYFLGVPTTALVVVGLCTSSGLVERSSPPRAGMSIANMGHLTCRYALPRRGRSFQCTMISRPESDRNLSCELLIDMTRHLLGRPFP